MSKLTDLLPVSLLILSLPFSPTLWKILGLVKNTFTSLSYLWSVSQRHLSVCPSKSIQLVEFGAHSNRDTLTFLATWWVINPVESLPDKHLSSVHFPKAVGFLQCWHKYNYFCKLLRRFLPVIYIYFNINIDMTFIIHPFLFSLYLITKYKALDIFCFYYILLLYCILYFL